MHSGGRGKDDLIHLTILFPPRCLCHTMLVLLHSIYAKGRKVFQINRKGIGFEKNLVGLDYTRCRHFCWSFTFSSFNPLNSRSFLTLSFHHLFCLLLFLFPGTGNFAYFSVSGLFLVSARGHTSEVRHLPFHLYPIYTR